MEFNDWSTHLMQVQIQTKAAELHLLHKNYDKVAPHIEAAKVALDKTLGWLATQGSSSGVDIIPILQRAIAGSKADDFSRPYIMAAIQEIEQLRGERQFWLKSGYDIGSKQ